MSPEFDSPALSAATAIARQLAATRSVPVLIAAERGAPAEELARLIHAASGDAPDRNWVAVRCRGVPERVIEAELFGDRDDRQRRNPPAVERARPGTLFIESVSDLGVPPQTRLEAFIEAERRAGRDRREPRRRRCAWSPPPASDIKSAVRQRCFAPGCSSGCR